MRPRLKPDFLDTIGQTGLSVTEFAARAGVSRGTIYAGLNPDQHPHRIGGVHRATAWKMAKAYAAITSISDADAFALLFLEHESD